jgi:hypothetical protein
MANEYKSCDLRRLFSKNRRFNAANLTDIGRYIIVPGKSWAEMTWQERREERFKPWLAAPGVKFVSPEAEKLHKGSTTTG